MDWKQLLASITRSVDEELRLRNTYLVTENQILRQQITGRVSLSDGDRQALAEIGQKPGRKALEEIATIAKPNTILAWHRKFATPQCDGSKPHTSVGRPRIDQELEALVVRMAKENRSWGYDRIVGALTHLGYRISDQTVGNILKRHGIPPAPERKTTMTWREFIRIHVDVLRATDFFTTEVGTWLRLVMSSVWLFLHLVNCKVQIGGMTPQADERWMAQMARDALMPDWALLFPRKYLLNNRAKQCRLVSQQLVDVIEMKRVLLLPRPPNSSERQPQSKALVLRSLLSSTNAHGDGTIQGRAQCGEILTSDERQAA